MLRQALSSTRYPYTTLFRSNVVRTLRFEAGQPGALRGTNTVVWDVKDEVDNFVPLGNYFVHIAAASSGYGDWTQISDDLDRKSTRLNSSHITISYAVFCLNK